MSEADFYAPFKAKILQFLSIFIIFFFISPIFSQSDYIVVRNITLEGNQKTRDHVIIHEMDVKPGDTIRLTKLPEVIEKNERRIKSIGLFNNASINLKEWDTETSQCNLEVRVQENWYIYPYLIFELADRNFNVWRNEFNYSLRRTNYGLAVNHLNLTGHKDKLKLKVQGGYTKKYELFYDFPYAIGKWGFSANLLYSDAREVAFKTTDNKQQFYKNLENSKITHLGRTSVALSKRNNAKILQTFRIEYTHIRVDSVIIDLNSHYFNLGKPALDYLFFDYTLNFDNTTYPLYPLNGNRFEFTVRKEGLGFIKHVNNSWLSIDAEQHIPVSKHIIFSTRMKFKFHLQPDEVPYVLSQAIGYKNDVLTGYQLYVMDGRYFGLGKASVRFRLLDHNFPIKKILPRQFTNMNAQLFARVNFDAGYSHDPIDSEENPLSNTLQYGYGPSLDLILYNNFLASIELGITKAGETGIYFSGGFIF